MILALVLSRSSSDRISQIEFEDRSTNISAPCGKQLDTSSCDSKLEHRFMNQTIGIP